MIGAGKPKIRFCALMISVLRNARQNIGAANICSKFSQPTHGLSAMPRMTENFLKAMVMLAIGA